MPWEAWFTFAVVAVIVAGLARNWAAPDALLLGGLTALVVVGMLFRSERLPAAGDAVAGFGNEGLVTVGVLFVVVAGLVRTGAMTMVTQPLLGRPQTVPAAQTRVMLPVAGLSAFLNNTPIVAMFLPVIDDLCKRTGLSPSKLLIPLSYASILGGVCTLIGTSTNLVVNGLVITQTRLPSLGMFEPAWVAFPCAIVGIGYMLFFSRWLLPERRSAMHLVADPRQYTVEMLVKPAGPLVGQSIEEAGLRHLTGLYLAEIEREGEILPAVGPQERLRAGDRLVFVGVVESVVELQKMRGLEPATDQIFKLDAPRRERCLIEAVVSDRCPLTYKTIRAGRFRTVYNAAVIAVARSGRRVPGKIGDIILLPGDTLLLEAHSAFVEQQRNSREFFLVSQVQDSAPPRHERAWAALAILAGMVTAVTAGLLPMLAGAMLAAALMVLTRCCTGSEARQSIDWSVLIVIGAALGIGQAMDRSGAAAALASGVIRLAGGNPWLVLLAVYLITSLFTELITNNAAAVLVFPLALAASRTLEVSFMPFVIAIMVAASASFATPIGYQTNLMVYGPGGYRFTDYLRFGLPMNLLVMTVTVLLAPWIWSFR